MKQFRGGVLAIGLATAVVAGCGGGDASPTTTPETIAPSSTTTAPPPAAGDDAGLPETDLPDPSEALNEITEITPIGDCSSDAIGLAVTTPEGWECRLLDPAQAGIAGFTLVTPDSTLNITVGSPSPLGPPCQALGVCGAAEPLTISENFPDTAAVTFAGGISIWGSHRSQEAQVVVTKTSALSPDESALLMTVLDSAVEL